MKRGREGSVVRGALHIAMLTPSYLPRMRGNTITVDRIRGGLEGRGHRVQVLPLEEVAEPAALADALAKISYSVRHVAKTNPRALAVAEPASLKMFYLVDSKTSLADERFSEAMKAEKGRKWVEIFMSHPLTYKRIEALKSMKV